MDDSGRLRLASDIEIVRGGREAAVCDSDDLHHAPVLPSPCNRAVNGYASPTCNDCSTTTLRQHRQELTVRRKEHFPGKTRQRPDCVHQLIIASAVQIDAMVVLPDNAEVPTSHCDVRRILSIRTVLDREDVRLRWNTKQRLGLQITDRGPHKNAVSRRNSNRIATSRFPAELTNPIHTRVEKYCPFPHLLFNVINMNRRVYKAHRYFCS